MKVHTLVFPAASVPVTVTSVVPTGNTLPEAGTLTNVAPAQLSEIVGVKVTTASHSPGSLLTIISAGQVTTGASSSFTVTLKVHTLVFPAASVPVTVTSVVPTGNTLPEAGTLTNVAPAQLSEIVGVKVTIAEHNPTSLDTVISAGQVTTGSSLSSTVTLKVHTLVLPAASVPVTVTSVVPTGNTLPEAGTLTNVAPAQLSEIVGVKVTIAEHNPASLDTVISAGQVTTGSSSSFTVTLKVQELVFPETSVPVTVTSVVPIGNTLPEAGTLETVTPGQLSNAKGVKVTTASH